MDIAICDDCRTDALLARDIIRKSLKDIHISADIVYYDCAEDIKSKLFEHKESLDILILDIDMPEISGLELAEELRANNMNLIIIFLTNHDEFVFKAFEFQPFRYIRKMYIKTEMPLAIRSAVKVIEANRDRQIVLNTDDGEMKVMLSEIMYLETEKRKIAVYLQNSRKLVTNKTISEILKMINKENFIMIHRSCVVNANYVKHMYDGIVILKNDKKLIASRRKFKNIKQQILMLWGDSI